MQPHTESVDTLSSYISAVDQHAAETTKDLDIQGSQVELIQGEEAGKNEYANTNLLTQESCRYLFLGVTMIAILILLAFMSMFLGMTMIAILQRSHVP